MSCARLRDLDAEQLFGREAEGMLLVHRRDVIEPVEIRDRLQVGLVLDQLLGAAMQQADMRIDALDHFAVELQHEAQHAVRRRMLRPEIDGEIAHRWVEPSWAESYTRKVISHSPALLAFSSPGST